MNVAPASSPSPTWPWLRLLMLAQVLVLLGIAALSYATDRWGTLIRLRTQPVDPTDVLYGDYVTLNYAISNLPARLWRGPGPVPRAGHSAWVLLRPAGVAFAAVSLHGEAPPTAPGEVALRGEVEHNWGKQLHLRYGLERFYLPQHQGHRLEQSAGDSSRQLVRVRVAPWGQVRLEGVDGF